ncbi:hypothetical protein HPB49_002374 [Dermacentor silvarum]|uniref:Uncharacterized protein n=1 Tax=Dermacentor silvarum TaxID=543639 RepID=A0ACB8DM15_DERSI|nr:hypothetical protein HPB49_002374 [Dermacentor silvarum]
MSKRRRLRKAQESSVMLLEHLATEGLEASSSDDDDRHIYANKFAELFAEHLEVPKVKGYVQKVVSDYSDKQFRSNFRLPRSACNQLVKQFEASECFPSDRNHGGVPVKSAEEHILSFLWYAVNKASMREVAVLFNMAESTQFAVIDRVLGFLCAIAPDVIYFGMDKEALAREFENLAGFPNVIGCIDGTYIPMRCPVNKTRSTYINRHDQVSLTMQGICNSKGRFQDVFTGPPSKVHDGRVLKLSTVQQDLPTLCQVNRYHILGDAAYPIREHLLTPFKNYGNMTQAKSKYNTCHASTRVVIENAFALLKQRFRQLRYIEFTTVDKITQFIVGCCVLHNICLDNGDIDVEDLLTDEEREERSQDTLLRIRQDRAELAANRQPQTDRESVLRRLGELKRNALVGQL